MLQLKDVCKSYTTADFTQVALDHVSLAFRDNEFVAILGPSGSGKTTMLNIIGGLDHYDSGDLLIDGISTKQYQRSRLGHLSKQSNRFRLPGIQPHSPPNHSGKRGTGPYAFRRVACRATRASMRGP